MLGGSKGGAFDKTEVESDNVKRAQQTRRRKGSKTGGPGRPQETGRGYCTRLRSMGGRNGEGKGGGFYLDNSEGRLQQGGNEKRWRASKK